MTSPLPLPTSELLGALDLIGTFVFALSGAASGVKHKLDVFGIGVLAFVAGNAGGVTRDLLIGAVPPAAILDWRYVAVSLAAGVVTFGWYPRVSRLQPIVLLFDAAGLGLFAVAGTEKALAFGVTPIVSALLGMLTGIGGGVVRDLLVSEIPVVLRADLYALAALAGPPSSLEGTCSIGRRPRPRLRVRSCVSACGSSPSGAAGNCRRLDFRWHRKHIDSTEYRCTSSVELT
jgi:uncharacterized membrane protein YeiH